ACAIPISAHGGDQDLGGGGDGGQVAGARVADRDRRVPVEQQVGQGLADDGGPADDDRPPALQLHLVVVEQRHHRGRRGGRERGQPGGPPAQRERVGAVRSEERRVG